MATSYWGVEHGDSISKAFPKIKNPMSLKPMAKTAKHTKKLISNVNVQNHRSNISSIRGNGERSFKQMLNANESDRVAWNNVGRMQSQARTARNTSFAVGAAGGTAAGAGGAVVARKKSVSKRAPGDRHPAFRPESFNSRKQNVKWGAAGGATSMGAVGGGLMAFGARKAGLPLKQGAMAAGAGAAGGAAYGGATGALFGSVADHKGAKGARTRQNAATDHYRAKQSFKKKKAAANAKYFSSYDGRS